MKRKNKAVSDVSQPSVAQVARLAGISISRVYRLRAEGRSDAEIVAGSVRRKEDAAVRDLPVVPYANGHAVDGAPSFADAQRAKEMWAAKLKELEYMERRNTLVPISYIRHWGANFLIGVRDEMYKIGELRDSLASESEPAAIQRLLDNWLERVMTKLHGLESLWAVSPPEVM